MTRCGRQVEASAMQPEIQLRPAQEASHYRSRQNSAVFLWLSRFLCTIRTPVRAMVTDFKEGQRQRLSPLAASGCGWRFIRKSQPFFDPTAFHAWPEKLMLTVRASPNVRHLVPPIAINAGTRAIGATLHQPGLLFLSFAHFKLFPLGLRSLLRAYLLAGIEPAPVSKYLLHCFYWRRVPLEKQSSPDFQKWKCSDLNRAGCLRFPTSLPKNSRTATRSNDAG